MASDHAGLGVERNVAEKIIDHEYFVSSSAANDLFYFTQAAQSAFSELSKQFVIIGHSQGGRAAWIVAQRQAISHVKDYFGAIAIALMTKTVGLSVDNALKSLFEAAIVPRIAKLFFRFDRLNLLTSLGEKRLILEQQIRENFWCRVLCFPILIFFNMIGRRTNMCRPGKI